MPAEPSSSTAPDSFVERRRFPRLKFAQPVQYRGLFKTGDPFLGSLTKDLGAGGMRVTIFSFLPKDDRLVVLFGLPGRRDEVRLVARVAWMQQRPYSESYDFGLEFVEIAREHREEIAGYVERGTLRPDSLRVA